MLLAHRIAAGELDRYVRLASGRFPSCRGALNADIRMIRRALTRGPIIEVTYAERTHRELIKAHGPYRNIPGIEERFSTVVPPYSDYWMEYEGPLGDGTEGRTGVAISVAEIASKDDMDKLAGFASVSYSQSWSYPFLAMICTIVIHQASMPVIGGVALLRCEIDGGVGVGEIVLLDSSVHYIGTQTRGKKFADCVCECIWPIIEAHSILSAKNVCVGNASNPKERIVRQGDKNIGKANFSWRHHTLVVKPIGGASEDASRWVSLDKSSGDLPLHAVRGNLATYTKDKPLFGKYTGKFYRPPHFRGSHKNGVVSKDYRIGTTPTETE